MQNTDAAFGFAQGVAGGGNTVPPVRVKNAAELRSALEALTVTSGPAVIELVGIPPDENAFDFGSGRGGNAQTIDIRTRRLTIRPLNAVVLKNVRFRIDCDVSDDILITGLRFHSDGAADGARDAIELNTAGPAPDTQPAQTASRVRITRCSFDGYFDIAIDSETTSTGPRVLVTIDHCLFFDAHPGELGSGAVTFANRGAINFGTEKKIPNGNAFVTVAYNVFIDVWRRSPRIAGGGRAHIFNNLLYRWGLRSATSPQQDGEGKPIPDGTFRGMEVGGGDNPPENDGIALIQANRFIPAEQRKDDLDRELTLHQNTRTDLRGIPPRRNRFDTPMGIEIAEGQPVPTVPPDRVARFDTEVFYTGLGLGLTAPQVVAPDRVVWEAVVASAGPTTLFPPDANTLRRELQAFLLRVDRIA